MNKERWKKKLAEGIKTDERRRWEGIEGTGNRRLGEEKERGKGKGGGERRKRRKVD